MSGSNFDGEIKDAMSPNSKAMPGKNKGGGKPSPNVAGKMNQSSGATAKPPGPPMQYKPPQPQANGQQGLTQATDEPFQGSIMPNGPTQPHSSGLQQAHNSIVQALAQRDMLKGH